MDFIFVAITLSAAVFFFAFVDQFVEMVAGEASADPFAQIRAMLRSVIFVSMAAGNTILLDRLLMNPAVKITDGRIVWLGTVLATVILVAGAVHGLRAIRRDLIKAPRESVIRQKLDNLSRMAKAYIFRYPN